MEKLLTIFLVLMFILSLTYVLVNVSSYMVREYTSLPLVLDGLPLDWPSYPRIHDDISVDGKIVDWYTEYYPFPQYRILRNITSSNDPYNPVYVWDYGNGNKYLYYRGEFIWFDAENDQRSGFKDRKYADITEIRVTSDQSHLYILVRFQDLGVVGGGASNPSVAVDIALDVDMNYRNGNTQLADGITHTPSYAPWDYQVLIDLSNPDVEPNRVIYGDGIPVSSGGSPVDIYNVSFADVSTNNTFFVVDPATESVEIAIAWSDLGVYSPWNISNVRIFAGVYISDGYGGSLYDLPDSDFIDVLSDMDTDNEVGDGVLDYWVDIGFNRAPEPVYYGHLLLDDKGYIQAWSDLSDDMRTDHIPNEAFDTDLLGIEVWRDTSNNQLYILIHVKGVVYESNNITPMIALVFDASPENETDGYDSWITAPSGYGFTDTQLGGRTQRNSTWSFILWIIPAENKTILLNGSREIVFTGSQYLGYSTHFIEAVVPIASLPALPVSYRLEVLCYAYLNPGSPLAGELPPTIGKPRQIINLTGSNAYDVLGPWLTWGVGVSSTYAVEGEFYDTDATVTDDYSTGEGDHWVDAYDMIKYATRLVNVTLHHVSYDNDSYIEIGEPTWATAVLEYYNGSSWVPLPGRTVRFYLVGSLVYLGSNISNANGTVYLYLGDLARRPDVLSGRYYLLASYDPPLTYTAGGDYMYSSVSNYSTIFYNIVKRPFIPSLEETPYITPILLAALLVILLLKRYYSRIH